MHMFYRECRSRPKSRLLSSCNSRSVYDLPFLFTGSRFGFCEHDNGESGSSVSRVSDYGLDDRAIEVQSPAETKGFFHWLLCPDRLWGTGGPFPGDKAWPRRDADHSPPI
jgi:hypothetical protein